MTLILEDIQNVVRNEDNMPTITESDLRDIVESELIIDGDSYKDFHRVSTGLRVYVSGMLSEFPGQEVFLSAGGNATIVAELFSADYVASPLWNATCLKLLRREAEVTLIPEEITPEMMLISD